MAPIEEGRAGLCSGPWTHPEASLAPSEACRPRQQLPRDCLAAAPASGPGSRGASVPRSCSSSSSFSIWSLEYSSGCTAGGTAGRARPGPAADPSVPFSESSRSVGAHACRLRPWAPQACFSFLLRVLQLHGEKSLVFRCVPPWESSSVVLTECDRAGLRVWSAPGEGTLATVHTECLLYAMLSHPPTCPTWKAVEGANVCGFGAH